ncbi:inositol monophosphatase family protein [Leptospira kirschneri str. 200801925]|uniref:Inositol monophosphatase family protein n=1 Tax=Leptospira kirschneri str. 200802841 TaxID=1193047 RepID=A0A828XZT9_9LEPT|nr:3'(2'),5'-bisphosphate nucleotidase CysQ [Leptospira kirschneri]EKO52783.1 inositol monophosphatase family protein [Leptospira kirschneri str. 200802841]EMO76139.1 inositol monophosphatase family protein [Leptospira kirschneri str. 200801925]
MNSIQYLQSAVDSVLEAGKIVLEIYHSDFKVKDKGKNDPVTEADLKASSHISESLRFLNIPILSEEDSEKKDVSQLQTVWILDPIDGTREFVHKNPEFAISLGLSVLGRAVLGVVFNPVTLELIYGAEDLGVVYQKLEKIPDSFSVELQNFTKILSDFKPIQKVLISRTEEKEGLFSSSMIPLGWEFAAMGSIAYKLGLVAAGKAALSISLKPKNDWDICAGIALINSSGGSDLEIRTGEPYKFQTLSGRGEGLIAGHTLSLAQVWESSKSYFQSSLRDWS